MLAYLDSSLLLRYILHGDIAVRQALEYPRLFSSELLEIECRRTLLRCRWQQDLDDEEMVEATARLDTVLTHINLIEMSARIKKRAMEAFPLHVKTLDALHMATMLILAGEHKQETLSLFSYDRGMNLCARALGLHAALL